MRKQKQTIGDIQFWNTCIVHYRNQRPKTLKGKIDLAINLNTARGWLKYAEGKLLRGTLVVLVLASIVLTTVGCQTLKGGLGDAAWISQKLADNIDTEGK